MPISRCAVSNANWPDSTAGRLPTPQVMRRTFSRNLPYQSKIPYVCQINTHRDTAFLISHLSSHAIADRGMAPAELTLLSIDNKSYCIQPGSKATLLPSLVRECHPADGRFVLATSIDWPQSSFTSHDRETVSQDFSAKDDVWCRSFLSCECDRRQCYNLQTRPE